MLIIVALTMAVILQFVAASIAISLIRQTRYNFSWLLVSIAFILMALRRLMELARFIQSDFISSESTFLSWTAVVISIFMLIGLIYIKHIFNQQKRIDELNKENESRILSAIIRTEENERQKFAKELHDGLGPLLSAIKMALSALDPDSDNSINLRILENSNNLINESVATIKEISNKLSPHVLNHFGLLRAIKSFIEKVESPKKLQIEVNSGIGDMRFAYNIEVVLYRIVCELITNTIHHAEASLVNIELGYLDKDLVLEYSDNGRGFNVQQVLRSHTGMGFANIQSRIKSINGTLAVQSKPGEGVTVKIVIKPEHYE